MTGVGKMRQLLLVFSHLYSWWPEVKTSIFCFTLLLLRWPELEKSDTWFCLKTFTFTMNGTGKNGNLYVSTLSNSWSLSSNKSQGSNGAIKSDTGQHSQFLRCLISRHKGRRPCLGLTCITDTPHPLHRLRTPAPPIKEREKEYDSLPPQSINIADITGWKSVLWKTYIPQVYTTSLAIIIATMSSWRLQHGMVEFPFQNLSQCQIFLPTHAVRLYWMLTLSRSRPR